MGRFNGIRDLSWGRLREGLMVVVVTGQPQVCVRKICIEVIGDGLVIFLLWESKISDSSEAKHVH